METGVGCAMTVFVVQVNQVTMLRAYLVGHGSQVQVTADRHYHQSQKGKTCGDVLVNPFHGAGKYRSFGRRSSQFSH